MKAVPGAASDPIRPASRANDHTAREAAGAADLVDRVRAKRAELVRSMIAAAEVELTPHLGTVRGALRAALVDDIAVEVETFLTCIRQGRRMSDAELSSILAIRALPAELHMPRYVLLRIHRLVLRSIWGALRTVLDEARAAEGVKPATWSGLSGAVHVLEAQVMAEMASIGMRSAERLVTHGDQAVARTALESLLVGDLDRFRVLKAAARFPHSLGPVHLVAAIGARHGSEGRATVDLRTIASQAATQLEIGSSRPIVGHADAETVAIIVPLATAGSAVRTLSEALNETLQERDRLAAGIGTCAPDISGIELSYRRARQALAIAASLHDPETRVLTFDKAAPYLMLSTDVAMARYCFDATLGEIGRRDPGGYEELVNTLRAYIDNRGTLSSTAEALGIHRHTLTSRLKRLERLAGRSLDDPEDYLLFTLGLHAARFLPIHAETDAPRPRAEDDRSIT